MADDYTLESFVEDLRRILGETQDEASILKQVGPLARRAALSPAWRSDDQYIADPELGFGSTLLHVEPDDSLFIVADSWLPGRGVNAHDHGTWAVVVGVDGDERNILWERVDDGSRPGHAELRRLDERVIARGDVLLVPEGSIHSVVNETARTTLSFHVYGRHLNQTGRSQFDPETRTEKPFLIETR
ncbi:hypothetical protein [Marinobacterium aestuariivivens]|uniref:Cysteine dioxygenase n=1 Tax=Marinobacterium aestuariivivens TaxID=1698799 RepID=A0ABW2A412_9GAMM